MAENASDKLIYLHGDLELTIFRAHNLPNMDMIAKHVSQCYRACTVCVSPSTAEDKDVEGGVDSQKLARRRTGITSDPYVTVSVPQATVARTRVIRNSKHPVWNEHFFIPLAHPVANLEFQVKDNDMFGAELIGSVKISAEKIATGVVIKDGFPLIGVSGKQPRPNCKLYLEIKFTPCEKNPLYEHGIAGDPDHNGVRNTYFPLRKGSSMRLYQDAHCGIDETKLPKIELDGGKSFDQNSCWEDICFAISEAHHMIYLVGWSIFHRVKLIREPTKPLPRGGELTLGELLKYKSEEGVRVLLLVWDDKTSHDKLFINTAGVMQTHDEETRKFFKHSSVICVLSPRYASSKLGIIKQQVVGTVFTHHQKCVLVDTQAFGNNRKITAFLGGLDLCDGRYDTPDHRLFKDLDSVFSDDFHNPSIPAGYKAPRQPWHDLHCRIDGPAAYDVLINFEQRWRRATRWKEFGLRKSMSHWHDDAMLKIERISWILSPSYSISLDGTYTIPADDPSLWVCDEKNPENWHVQIFRSIDSGSVKGFPRTADVAQAQHLTCSKSLVIDKSIQTAYIQAIRSAKNFIYIENQYFIGSSYAWPSYKDAGAENLIPVELALKIASKIRAGERFSVYVVIPMWPEGDPNSAAMQEILFWQNQTMQTMFGIVGLELEKMRLTGVHPRDYLNFYCLGKREENTKVTSDGSSTTGNKVCDSEKNQRFMIYVHAKGMVVDDEYVIIGSANINQRSLAGTKDTEIAMGAYQPHHTWAKKNKHPRGQVYGYRTSLWAEHLGGLHECFDTPESLECMKTVNKVAEENWRKFTDVNFKVLQGHLMQYPIEVSIDGKVSPLTGFETFPDVGGKITGAHSQTIPDVLTT